MQGDAAEETRTVLPTQLHPAGKSTTRFVRRGYVTAIKEELRNYKRLQKLIDKWVELEMRLSQLRLDAARK